MSGHQDESMDKSKNIEQEVRKLIASILGQPWEELSLEVTMNDTPKWDSLAHINIVCAIEKFIGARLTLNEIIDSVSIRDWVNVTEKKIRLSAKGQDE